MKSARESKSDRIDKEDNCIHVVLISDTHEQHRKLNAPDGDILLLAGDVTFFNKNVAAVRDLNAWLGDLPHKYKVTGVGKTAVEVRLIGGNSRTRV